MENSNDWKFAVDWAVETPTDSEFEDSSSTLWLKDYPHWQTARNEVDQHLNNLPAWEKLIKVTENFLLIKPMNNNHKQLIVKTFDELLTRFPLFTNYWKRYAAAMYQIDGAASSQEILSRALDSHINSLDLWVQYIDGFGKKDLLKLRVAFEMAGDSAGRQFMAHTLWDKYIEFEQTLKVSDNVYTKNKLILGIYLKIIDIPLYQYAKYFQDFKAVRKNFTPQQLEEADPQLEKYIATQENYQKMNHQEQLNAIEAYYATKYSKAAVAVNSRWKYESKFKPSTFSFAPVPKDSLQLFDDYLTFEEKEGTKESVIALFERVLVPCAAYEKFWVRYIQWYLKHYAQDKDKIKSIYQKAVDTFLPVGKDILRLNYLYYLESIGETTELPFLYGRYCQIFKLSETEGTVFKQYLCYLKRVLGVTEYSRQAEILINERKPSQNMNEEFQKLAASVNDTTISVLIADYLITSWNVLNKLQSQLARSFEKYAQLEPVKSSFDFWLVYLNFEIARLNYKTLRYLINKIMTRTYLPPDQIKTLVCIHISNAETNAKHLVALDGWGIQQVFEDVLKLKKDIESPFAYQLAHKQRLAGSHLVASIDKALSNTNGNIGITVEERPVITNQIPLYENLTTIPPLPTFKNVEKASLAIKYPEPEQV